MFRPAPLDARHLRLVLAIVDEGGLTRAGERLNVTQSALSHSLRQIETSLGVPLFVRARKRLVLTPAGEELVARSRAILADLDSLEDDLRRRAAGWRGTLRLATECFTCYEWLPPLLKRFGRRHANVDVRIVAEATHEPVKALAAGELDMAIVMHDPQHASLTKHPLFEDEMLLIVAPDHRLAERPFVRASDFENERLLLYGEPEESFFYRNFFARSSKKPARIDSIRLTEAILAMVKAGLGVTVAAKWAMSPELASGRLTGVRLGPEGFHRTWSAVTRANVPRYVTEFVDLMASSAMPARFSARAS